MASPAPVPTTIGELLFQDYLKAMEYPYEFEKPFPGKSKRPDYTVTRNGVFFFDVKDFDPNLPISGFGYYDPYTLIREKIDAGRSKFQEFKDFPCSLVLKNNGNAFVDLQTPDIMLGSMYGDAGFSFPVDTNVGKAVGPMKRSFLGRGKMIRPTHHQNTTISALITLRNVRVGARRYERVMKENPNLNMDETLAAATERYPGFDIEEQHLGVIVWENAVARIALPRELFDGPYDERWGFDGTSQSMTFRGEKLAAVSEEIS